jgi:dCTP deaminase
MLLSDVEIRKLLDSKELGLDPEPTADEAYQPLSIDVRLSKDILRYPVNKDLILERGCPQMLVTDVIESEFILEPDEFILGSTLEYLRLPEFLYARIEGKSSLGRLGLLVHATAGFIDPGFRGNVTLEIKNINTHRIKLKKEMYIAQVCFGTYYGCVRRVYGSSGLNSRYQDSIGTVGPR